MHKRYKYLSYNKFSVQKQLSPTDISTLDRDPPLNKPGECDFDQQLSLNLEKFCTSVKNGYHRAEIPILPVGARSPKSNLSTIAGNR